MKTTVIEINLQEGFIVASGFPIAAYSHHHKVIIMRHPHKIYDYKLSTTFDDYEVLIGLTDSFSMGAWNPTEQKHTELYSLIKQSI